MGWASQVRKTCAKAACCVGRLCWGGVGASGRLSVRAAFPHWGSPSRRLPAACPCRRLPSWRWVRACLRSGLGAFSPPFLAAYFRRGSGLPRLPQRTYPQGKGRRTTRRSEPPQGVQVPPPVFWYVQLSRYTYIVNVCFRNVKCFFTIKQDFFLYGVFLSVRI